MTPLLCYRFIEIRGHVDEVGKESPYDSFVYRGYRRLIEAVLRHKGAFITGMIVLLAGAVTVLATLPYDFLPKSDRLQFQGADPVAAGHGLTSNSRDGSGDSRWLDDKHVNPEVVDSIGLRGRRRTPYRARSGSAATGAEHRLFHCKR